MKLAAQDRNVERVGNISTEHTFKIKSTAKAFSILSSKLYKHKIRAIIREISCNALDAHRAVNNETRPFDVHIPTSKNPIFSVRDYGTGLSDEDIYEVYTTFFESTKTDSNKFTGALGLGSKSPFSYVNEFNIVSRYEGVRRNYVAMVNETGEPSIRQIGRAVPCAEDEENGLEVVIPVKAQENGSYGYHQGDVQRFRNTAIEVFAAFHVKPNITTDAPYNDIDFGNLDTITAYTKGNFIAFSSVPKYVYDGHGYSSFARMGDVVYPIDSSEFSNGELTNGEARLLTSATFLFEFEIGDLDITAGREELSYVPDTRKKIVDAVKKTYADIKDDFLKNFESCKSEYQACEKYADLVTRPRQYNDKTFCRSLIEVQSHIPVFHNGIEIDNRLRIDLSTRKNLILRVMDRMGQVRPSVITYTKVKHSCIEPYFDLSFYDKMVFVIDDMPRGSIAAMKKWHEIYNSKERQNPVRVRTILVSKSGKTDEEKEAAKTEYKELLHLVRHGVIVKASDAPKEQVVREKKTVIPRQLTSMVQDVNKLYEPSDMRKSYLFPDEIDPATDFEKGGVYVVSCGGQYNFEQVKSVIYSKTLRELIDFPADRFHLVQKSVSKPYLESENWLELDEFIQQKFSELPEDKLMVLLKKREYHRMYQEIKKKYSYYGKSRLRMIKNISLLLKKKKHVFRDYAKEMMEVPESIDDSTIVFEYLDKFGIPIPEMDLPDLLAMTDDIAKKYPLLKAVYFNLSYYSVDDDLREMIPEIAQYLDNTIPAA